jgi:hypothetical protein
MYRWKCLLIFILTNEVVSWCFTSNFAEDPRTKKQKQTKKGTKDTHTIKVGGKPLSQLKQVTHSSNFLFPTYKRMVIAT